MDHRRRSPHRAVRLLAAPPLQPLPTAEDVLGHDEVRRPGDLHEPAALGNAAAAWLAEEAGSAGVSADVAASVLLEAALVAREIASAKTGEMAVPGVPLTAAEASYVRALTLGRRRRRIAPPRVVSVPARIIRRVAAHSADDLLRQVSLERALEREVAAVRAGFTLTEWALVGYSAVCSPGAASASEESSPSKSAL